MKNLVRSLFLFFFGVMLFSFLCHGCATVEETPDSWIGRNQSELISSWGPPAITRPDGKGGSILTYEEYFRVAEIPGRIEPIGGTNVVYTKPKEAGYVQMTIFHVDENGYIYKWEERKEER